ncbi:MAG: hypothetical protein IPM26_04565 [Saprospiraceae bacterium]|nr:hypothetical protein [Saprospiraceae bacterium]
MLYLINIAFPKPIKSALREVIQSGSAKGELWLEKKQVRNEEAQAHSSFIRKAKRVRTRKF